MKIYLHNFGCKLNQAEADDLKADLQKIGCLFVGQQNFEIAIINLCAVTHGAEQGGRQLVNRLKRLNPQAKIFTTGCAFGKLEQVDKHFSDKKDLVKFFQECLLNKKISPLRPEPFASLRFWTSVEMTRGSKTRALIGIQTGCDWQCSYCVVPFFRGQNSKSFSDSGIIKKIKQKEKQGFQEFVITGVNILQYKFGKDDFVGLIKKILSQTKIPRIRFSSLDPRLITEQFFDLLKNRRICLHLHLSLQSGSNKILKLMNRHYTTEKYFKIVNQAGKINPNVSVTTDIIVGFPGETEQDIEQTAKFIKKVNFLKVHLFPFSKRPNTPAGQMTDNLPARIKKERFKYLEKVAQKSRQDFFKEMIGQEFSVLFESKKNGRWFGYTENYIPIILKSNKNLSNKIIQITLTKSLIYKS